MFSISFFVGRGGGGGVVDTTVNSTKFVSEGVPQPAVEPSISALSGTPQSQKHESLKNFVFHHNVVNRLTSWGDSFS